MTTPVLALVSPSDIADLADVSRAAVSNWRNRQADFPASVGGTEANPLFPLEAVVTWLRGRGYKVSMGRGEVAAWAAMSAIRHELAPEEAVDIVLALACVRRVLPDVWKLEVAPNAERAVFALPPAILHSQVLARMISEEFLPSLRKLNARTIQTLVALVELFADADSAYVTDALLARTARSQVKRGADGGYVGSRVSGMLAALAGNHRNAKAIYDPACGIGVSLMDASARLPHTLALVGQELSVTQARIAMQRALLRGVDMDVHVGDTLAQDEVPLLRADVIVAEPPFGMPFDVPAAVADGRFRFGIPPRSAADLAWVQHCVAHLSDSGVAFVVTPVGPLSRPGPEGLIRGHLLERGCVRAVVTLPGKLHPHTSIPLAVWILQAPADRGDAVLLIDGTDDAKADEHVASWLDPETTISAPHRRVPIAELLHNDAVLDPGRYLNPASDPAVMAASLATSLREIRTAIAHSSEALDRAMIAPKSEQPRMVSLGELIRQGVIDPYVGRVEPARDAEFEGDTGTVHRKHVRGGVLPKPFAADSETELSRPGDVLVVTSNGPTAAVDRTGGHRIGVGVYRLRISVSGVLLPEYLAAVLEGPWNSRRFGSTAGSRPHFKELEIPVVSVEAQKAFVQRHAAVRALSGHARLLAENAATAEASLLEGVRLGV